MVPLALVGKNGEAFVRSIGGGFEQRRHLENLGFTAGEPIVVVNEMAGNLIVRVKDTRIALNKETARKIMVQEV